MSKEENIVVNPDGNIFYLEKHNPYEKETNVSDVSIPNDQCIVVIDNEERYINITTYEIAEELEKCSKFIRAICCIEAILNVLNTSMFFPYAILVVIVSVCGYQGAIKYDKKLIMVYISYTYVKLIMKVFMIMYCIKNLVNILTYFTIAISTVFDLYVVHRTNQFYKLLP